MALKEIPTIGQEYIIECINNPNIFYQPIPIIDKPHIDDGIEEHYHIDYRFISDEDLEENGFEHCCSFKIRDDHLKYIGNIVWPAYSSKYVQDIIHKKLVCLRRFDLEKEMIGFNKIEDISVNFDFVQNLAKKNKWKLQCMKCPHHGTDLSSCKSNIKGNVICPQHGLKFNLETKECIYE